MLLFVFVLVYALVLVLCACVCDCVCSCVCVLCLWKIRNQQKCVLKNFGEAKFDMIRSTEAFDTVE